MTDHAADAGDLRQLIQQARVELEQDASDFGFLQSALERLAKAVNANRLSLQDVLDAEYAFERYPRLQPMRGLRRVGDSLQSSRRLLIELRNQRVQLTQGRKA